MSPHLWRRISFAGAVVAAGAWVAVEATGLIGSVAVVNRISFLALVWSFVTSWRADVPAEDEDT